MKKLLTIWLILLWLATLYGCWEKIDNVIRKPINNLTDQEKYSNRLDSVNEAVTTEQEEQQIQQNVISQRD